MTHFDVLKAILEYEKRIAELEKEVDLLKNPIYCPKCGTCGEEECCRYNCTKALREKVKELESVRKFWMEANSKHAVRARKLEIAGDGLAEMLKRIKANWCIGEEDIEAELSRWNQVRKP